MQSKLFSTNKTLNFQGRLTELDTPLVMGVLNVTPDSFYDGFRYTSREALQAQVARMLHDGAAIIDVGGYSSRPGAAHISEEEELARVLPAIDAILERHPEALISIDTFRSGVARAAVQAGASMINDISAGALDERMLETVAALKVPYVAMHMRGTPQTMRQETHYEDVVAEVIEYFHKKLAVMTQLGIRDVVIDPGFGFAKNAAQNFKLLQELHRLQILGKPVLAGLSRKSMIWKTLGITPDGALNGTSALNMVALQKGACILRVHDVLEARQCIQLYQHLKNQYPQHS